MDEYGWGLTSAGFRRPTYNELLDALEHKARELFGATANLTVRSPLGLFLRILQGYSISCSLCWKMSTTVALWTLRLAPRC